MKKFLLIIIVFIISSCSAINPILTPTPTQLPTPTPIPTATINPCSDEGWNDISIYLKQFNQAKEDMKVGDSISALLEQLENIKDEVSDVNVAACTEYAKQTILKGLNTEILSFYSLFVEKDNEKFIDLFLQGTLEIEEAVDELKTLGIELILE